MMVCFNMTNKFIDHYYNSIFLSRFRYSLLMLWRGFILGTLLFYRYWYYLIGKIKVTNRPLMRYGSNYQCETIYEIDFRSLFCIAFSATVVCVWFFRKMENEICFVGYGWQFVRGFSAFLLQLRKFIGKSAVFHLVDFVTKIIEKFSFCVVADAVTIKQIHFHTE